MKIVHSWVLALIITHFLATKSLADEALYFPPFNGKWESIAPNEVGWDKGLIRRAMDFAGDHNSSGVVILLQGRILAEQYWEVTGDGAERYQRMVSGRDSEGRAIEDVASAQKSVASLLIGVAQEKGLFDLEDPVHKYLGKSWSKANQNRESSITIRHLLSMTCGLNDRRVFKAAAGTEWKYNTGTYSKTIDILEKISGRDINNLTRDWLLKPTGMSNSRWVRRGAPELQLINGHGFATTARDLARFGLLMIADGTWEDQSILSDKTFIKISTTSSQKLNPHYGLLRWVNKDSLNPEKPLRLPEAPRDMYSANGALNRR